MCQEEIEVKPSFQSWQPLCPSLTLYWLVEVVSSLLQHTTATNELDSQIAHGISALVVWTGTFWRWTWIGTDKARDQTDSPISVIMQCCYAFSSRQTHLVYLLNDGVENITDLMTTRARITNFGNQWQSFDQLYGYWQNKCYSKAQMATAFLGQGSKSHVLHNHDTAEEKA